MLYVFDTSSSTNRKEEKQMANVIIKTNEQREHEKNVLNSFGVNHETATAEQREYAQQISRQTAEIERRLR